MDTKALTDILGGDYEDLAKSIMKKDFDISKVSPQLGDLLESDKKGDILSSLLDFLDKSDDEDSNGILDNVKTIAESVGFDLDDVIGSVIKGFFK